MQIYMLMFTYYRFILENSVLDKHVRLILSIYPVVIWALTGVYTETYNPAAPTRNNIFIGEENFFFFQFHRLYF